MFGVYVKEKYGNTYNDILQYADELLKELEK